MSGPSKKDFLDPLKEAQAVAALRAAIGGLGEDEALLLDTIEGQTSLLEIIDALLDRMREAEVVIAGIETITKGLGERKTRYENAQKRDRAMIEQALTIAGLSTLVRPTATLSIATRAPSLVITEEAEIPARFWKKGDPTLDRKALTEALKDRAKALAAPAADRDRLLAEAPDVPGATLSNGAPSLTIRIK